MPRLTHWLMRETGTRNTLKEPAPPKVLLSVSSSEEPTLTVPVTCTLDEFYPASADVALTSTCGGYQGFENHTVPNLDGTYSATHSALLDITGCRNVTEVACFIKHDTGEWRMTRQISGMKNKGQRHRFPSECLIKSGILAVFVLIICVIFKSYNVCSEKQKEERTTMRSPESDEVLHPSGGSQRNHPAILAENTAAAHYREVISPCS
ncbi:uncharacterized protein LOC144771760 [Lissotriton helveticus]